MKTQFTVIGSNEIVVKESNMMDSDESDESSYFKDD